MNIYTRFRSLIGIMLTAAMLLANHAANAAEIEPPAVAVLGFELVDDHPDPARADLLRGRLSAITKQLEKGLHERKLYRVVETGAAQDLIADELQRNEFLYRCNNCLAAIGQRLETRLVVVGWVQRVSELILNINISVQDSQTGAELLTKSVDLRGNTDETWKRGIDFMLRDWSERRTRNSSYGL